MNPNVASEFPGLDTLRREAGKLPSSLFDPDTVHSPLNNNNNNRMGAVGSIVPGTPSPSRPLMMRESTSPFPERNRKIEAKVSFKFQYVDHCQALNGQTCVLNYQWGSKEANCGDSEPFIIVEGRGMPMTSVTVRTLFVQHLPGRTVEPNRMVLKLFDVTGGKREQVAIRAVNMGAEFFEHGVQKEKKFALRKDEPRYALCMSATTYWTLCDGTPITHGAHMVGSDESNKPIASPTTLMETPMETTPVKARNDHRRTSVESPLVQTPSKHRVLDQMVSSANRSVLSPRSPSTASVTASAAKVPVSTASNPLSPRAKLFSPRGSKISSPAHANKTQLPSSPLPGQRRKADNNNNNNKAKPLMPGLVFGRSLDELMAEERAQPRGGAVPHVLVLLVQRLVELNGFRVEGVFRIAPEQDRIKKMQDLIDQGNFSDLVTMDVHETATMIKRFLKGIRGGCIPLYKRCIAASKTSSEMAAIWAELPADNQELLKYLAHLVQMLLRHEQFNLMPLTNLMVVLTPALFEGSRPGDDLAALMNLDAEREFGAAFFTWIMAEFPSKDEDLMGRAVPWNATQQSTIRKTAGGGGGGGTGTPSSAPIVCAGCGEPVTLGDDSAGYRALGRGWHAACAQMVSPRGPPGGGTARKRVERGGGGADEDHANVYNGENNLSRLTPVSKGLKTKRHSSPHNSIGDES